MAGELLLLDPQVLLAIAWPNHQFHSAASERLESSDARWATCGLIQIEFIRLSSDAQVVPTATTPSEAAALLAAMVSDPLHVYLEELPSPTGPELLSIYEKISGARQVLPAYLLLVAKRHKATLLTFDARLKALAAGEVDVEVVGR
jgi:predicted nucleic acid-binding protein